MSSVRLATRTMDAINAAMVADQGASFRQWEQKVLPCLDDAYRGVDEPFRSHMGASLQGDECARAIWYSFRWFTRPKFDGRILRLFNRGHLEEGRVISALLSIGVQVFQQDANGKQFRIAGSSGHYGGSGDGFALGIPDLPPDQHCGLEVKTHNDKSFADLKAKGVRISKTEHFAQMQQYMRKFNVPVCLYVAVNKNNDEYYMEIVTLDAAVADQYIDRADRIIWMHSPPKKINESPGWFGCKWCDHRPVCHLGAKPDMNCRTCAFSEPRDTGDAVWHCKLHQRDIPKEIQLSGCGSYEIKNA